MSHNVAGHSLESTEQDATVISHVFFCNKFAFRKATALNNVVMTSKSTCSFFTDLFHASLYHL